MHDKLFPTQEIGSLAKPAWRVKGYRGEELSDKELAEAEHWGRKLKVENFEAFLNLLREKDSPEKRRAILEWAAKYAIRFFEAAGLDIIFDGEQWRSEMYEHVLKSASGFKFLGYVKSFDYRYFNKAACIAKPKYKKPFYVDEFIFARKNTNKILKVPFTGPYTIIDWTFNEYYERKVGRKIHDFKAKKFEAKREFLFDFIKEVARPELNKLIDAGATWIQIDEPAATTNPSDMEMKLFVEAFNETVKGLNCTFSLHNCYSNYKVLARYACELKNCSQLALEFANRDSCKPGMEEEKRVGYREIKLFEESGFKGNYGVGVIDVHTDFIETPELVRDRILYAVKSVGDPSRICVSTDCGLRTRTWEVSFQKLRNMVLGAELARKSFG
ncbi:MAG: hypothetical protein QW667_04605 [Candidatus Bathyarchaeia archaeon]